MAAIDQNQSRLHLECPQLSGGDTESYYKGHTIRRSPHCQDLVSSFIVSTCFNMFQPVQTPQSGFGRPVWPSEAPAQRPSSKLPVPMDTTSFEQLWAAECSKSFAIITKSSAEDESSERAAPGRPSSAARALAENRLNLTALWKIWKVTRWRESHRGNSCYVLWLIIWIFCYLSIY